MFDNLLPPAGACSVLVLEDGARAAGVGQVFMSPATARLTRAETPPGSRVRDLPNDADGTIALHGLQDAKKMVSQWIVAHGTWRDTALDVSNSGSVALVLGLPTHDVQPGLSSSQPATISKAPELERQLLQNHTIAQRIIRKNPPEVLVIAHDERQAEMALRPIYGDALRIVPSRWSAADLAAAETAMAQLPDQQVVAIGHRIGEDDQIRLELMLTHVDRRAADVLESQADVLGIGAIVTPSRGALDQ